MSSAKPSFLDKVLGRIGRLDKEGLQTVVQRLARERNFLETLFNIIEDGVLVVDESGRIIYFNQAVTRLLGASPDSSEGHQITRYLPEAHWKKLSDFDHAGGKKIIRHELEVEYPRPRYLWLYAAPLDGDAVGSSGVALILHDATETRQKTFEAIESERIQALTLLAASVAHEIGNPLNALHIHLQLMERELKKIGRFTNGAKPPGINASTNRMGTAAVLDDRETIAKLDKYLGVAKGEIARLDYIITQFLQAIRPSQPQMKPTPLNNALEASTDLLRPELENRGITLKQRLSKRLPAVMHDPAQIQQVVVNLIKNAMQAMTNGGVLTVATGSNSENVWIEIGDTGGGIPQEQIKRIFEPFYTTKKKGTGLGLMIVQRIVRDHGGRIELESQLGKGAMFRILLPLQQRPPRLLESQVKSTPL